MNKQRDAELRPNPSTAKRQRVRIFDLSRTVHICEADALYEDDSLAGAPFKGELHIPDAQTRRLLIKPTLLMETSDGRRAEIVTRFLSSASPAVAFSATWFTKTD